MAKELMWVCALLPPEIDRQLVTLCKEENRSVGLPEEVFRFPLHISLKKSFQTTDFDAVKAEVGEYLRAKGPIRCRTSGVVCHKRMLWLPVQPDGAIGSCHEELDTLLQSRYAVPIDRFDAVFRPHISLFTRGTREQLDEMQRRLSGIAPMELTLDRFVIGSSGHGDTFLQL
jgi:2'-5' RNA ligase